MKDKKIIQTKKNGALGRKGNCANGRFKAVKEEKTKIIQNVYDHRNELELKSTTEVIEDYAKTHKCPKCGKGFEKLMSLKGHILRSDTCREEKLKNHEGLRFQKKKDKLIDPNSNDHRNDLTLENTTEVIEDYTKTYKCPKCGKEFKKLMVLKDHILESNTCRKDILKNHEGLVFETLKDKLIVPNSNLRKSTESKYLSDHASRIMASSIMASNLANKDSNTKNELDLEYPFKPIGQTFEPQTDQLSHIDGPDSRGASNLERNPKNLEAVKHKIEIKGENELLSNPLDEYEKFRCGECGTLFRKREDLQSHILILHKKKISYPCVYLLCNKRFATKQTMEFHFESQHQSNESKYLSDNPSRIIATSLANKDLNAKNELDLDYPFKPIGQTSEPQTDKLSHIDRPDSSGASNLKAVKHKIEIQEGNELLSHPVEGYEKFRCGECGTLFKKREDLQSHILIVHKTGEITFYSCLNPLCNMLFASKQTMGFHFESHHKNQPHSQIMQNQSESTKQGLEESFITPPSTPLQTLKPSISSSLKSPITTPIVISQNSTQNGKRDTGSLIFDGKSNEIKSMPTSDSIGSLQRMVAALDDKGQLISE